MLSGDQRNRRHVLLPSVNEVVDNREDNRNTIDQRIPVHGGRTDWSGDWEEQEDPNGEKVS